MHHHPELGLGAVASDVEGVYGVVDAEAMRDQGLSDLRSSGQHGCRSASRASPSAQWPSDGVVFASLRNAAR